MTETTGYFCLTCLCWWTTYLNKGDTLYCGCKAPKKDAIWLYRKTYGNTIFGLKEKNVQVKFKDRELVLSFKSALDKTLLKKFVLWSILETPNHDELWQNQNYIYIAVKEALTSASNRGQYHYRCQKCQHWKKVPGQKCELYDPKAFLSIACEQFSLKEPIKTYLIQQESQEEHPIEMLRTELQQIGCSTDNWDGIVHTHFTIKTPPTQLTEEPPEELEQPTMWRCLSCGWQFRFALKNCLKCGSLNIEAFNPLHDEPQMPS
jgi:RNase P subunit RPR2